ncbi:MAG TPA: AMP-binding protein, partial [bacterium]|nr:AMP-binding protein [bacterium]
LPQPAPIISFLPMAHAYSCSFEFLFPFTVGAHITFLGVIPSPKILLEAFAEVRPCLVISVPLVMEKIFKKRIAPVINTAKVKLLLKTPGISSLLRRKIKKALREAFGGKYEVIVIGGAALNPEIEEFFRKIKLRFTVGYGMTECGPLISYAPWDEHRPGSVGKVVTNLEIKIDSPSPATQAGEIMVKGEHVMAGYYKNPTATDEVLGEDGWLRTGDLGIIDKDGFIFIRGRSKNMILGPSGQNIYPEEIENKINSMEFVQESLVIESEGRPIALIYPDWEAIDSLKPKQQDREGWLNKVMENIKKEVNRQLPRYAAISRVKVQPEPFEKTPTQKIKRYLYKI